MTSLYFGLMRDGVPADQATVRSTADVYDKDAPAAMQDSMPDRGEIANDSNPALGLVNRQLGSKWVQGIKNAPFWKREVDDAWQHNAIIDKQVSSSGTAAAREADGEWGHPSLEYAVGIEPVGDLTDGGKMTNEYFTRTDRDIQETSDNTMMSVPPGYDQDTKGKVSALGKTSARDAAAAAYNAFWNGGN